MDGNTIAKSSVVSNIYQQQAASQQPSKQANNNQTDQKLTIETNKVDSVRVSSKVTLRNLDTARAIEQMHASLNQQAKSVRETNETINTAVDRIDTMKNSLQEITKNYPPFPVDSKQRNEILMEYTSLRKELIQLMVPPPPPPVYEKVQHMWSSLFDQNGQINSAAIPEVTKTNSDESLQKINDKLVHTTTNLAELSDKVTQALVNPNYGS
jgi:hypothetical protein